MPAMRATLSDDLAIITVHAPHGTLDRSVFARAREALDDRVALTLSPVR